MKTFLSELLSNGNASKFFWSILTSAILGGVGWLTYLSVTLFEVRGDQKVTATEKDNIKEDVSEVKENVKEIKQDVKEIQTLLYAISKKV